MNNYITGATIKTLREKKQYTQNRLAQLLGVATDRIQLVKLHPEGNAEIRLQLRGMGRLYIYCNKHGSMHCKK